MSDTSLMTTYVCTLESGAFDGVGSTLEELDKRLPGVSDLAGKVRAEG